MSVVAADYESVLTNVRRALAQGGTLSGPELRQIIDVIESAAGASTAAVMAQTVTDIDQQFDTLDAFTGSDSAATIVAAIATASTALRADATGLAASPLADVSVDANDVLDGR